MSDNNTQHELSFPSPARDYWQPPLSLDSTCKVSNPSVFLLRYRGTSRRYVKTGCVLVVDRSVKPGKKDIVVVVHDEDLTLHEFHKVPKEEDVEIWGTVTHVLNDLRAG